MLFYTYKKKIITLINILRSKVFFYKGLKKSDLLIFDDIFPNPLSGFRCEEFSQIVLHFENSKIVTNGKSYKIVGTPVKQHNIDIEKFKIKNPLLKNKIFKSSKFLNINTKLFYCIFLNNIYDNLFWIEKHKIPFVFTLYPGGGFQIDDETSNRKLRKVFNSPQFRQVITTQNFTTDYLLKNNFCQVNKIKYIFGGVVPQLSLKNDFSYKQQFLTTKKTLDICFCAAKYMPKGLDKGYDVFIELAHLLMNKYDFVRFHVIGGFGQNDIDVTLLKNNITFYGYQDFENLHTIFKNIDLIISPNKPFFLNKGSFDGFPLGTVVEAVLNGVVAMVTDILNQNTLFKNNEEIIIINPNAHQIELEIINLINNPTRLFQLSQKSRAKFVKIYSNDYQILKRIELLKTQIALKDD